MAPSYRVSSRFRPSLSLVLFAILLGTLCLAGGASHPDVAGQPVVNVVAWGVLVVAILFGSPPSLAKSRPVFMLLVATGGLVLLQLLPLPPVIWEALPGRAVLAGAQFDGEGGQPWRPWSIVPGATTDALVSLIVPFVTWLLVLSLDEDERRLVPGMLLSAVMAFMFVGLLQFSGVVINNAFVNDTPGQVSGMFANRNHFALFLAIGCLVAPVWGFSKERASHWRAPIACGLTMLLFLTILASGSRAGLGLGLVALLLGLALSHKPMRSALAGYPRWVFPALVAAIIGLAALFVLASVMADRAVSIDRLFTVDAGQDMRARGLPVVLKMIGAYFPFGTGAGAFDPMFRLHEPLVLLKPTYFNHAHNDFLEVALDAGLPGMLLLIAALSWWAWASGRAWRSGAWRDRSLSRLGSAILLLLILASIVDYPARTPMIAAVAVIAAVWLSGHSQEAQASPLPRSA